MVPPGDGSGGEWLAFVEGHFGGDPDVDMEEFNFGIDVIFGEDLGESSDGELSLPGFFSLWGDFVACVWGWASSSVVNRGEERYQEGGMVRAE
jgi:hypothetical protein